MAGPPQAPPPPPDPYAQNTNQPMYDQPAPPPKSGMATAALILGLISIPAVCVCVGPLAGLIAIVLGIIALVSIAGNPQRHTGKGRAWGGIVTGALSIVLTVVIPLLATTVQIPGVSSFMNAMTGGAQMGLTAQGLQSYQSQYQAFPPDLQTLDDAGYLQANPFATDGGPLEGMYYVPGLTPSDPGNWILAYASHNVMGQELVATIYVSGTNEMIPKPQFEQKLKAFKDAYEADRGEPPTIIEPPATDETSAADDTTGSAGQ